MSYMSVHDHIPPGGAAAVDLLGPEAMEEGGRFAGTWSVAFQGGTLERLQQRRSGDFSLAQQTKYIATLPGLPERVDHLHLHSITWCIPIPVCSSVYAALVLWRG